MSRFYLRIDLAVPDYKRPYVETRDSWHETEEEVKSKYVTWLETEVFDDSFENYDEFQDAWYAEAYMSMDPVSAWVTDFSARTMTEYDSDKKVFNEALTAWRMKQEKNLD